LKVGVDTTALDVCVSQDSGGDKGSIGTADGSSITGGTCRGGGGELIVSSGACCGGDGKSSVSLGLDYVGGGSSVNGSVGGSWDGTSGGSVSASSATVDDQGGSIGGGCVGRADGIGKGDVS
jgi:hypothetical protein